MAHCDRCNLDQPDGTTHCKQCGGELADGPDPLIGSQVLGRYRIVRMLAEGGMGRVYIAEQTVGTVVRRVAVKVVRPQLGTDRQLVSRFSREAETLVRLTHPNTVQLFDFGALADGSLALAMEFVEGRSLAAELLEHGPMAPARVERLLAQACGALEEAHAHGIVHRDLKPDNMLIAERTGHRELLKVVDFGIAKVSSENEAAATTKLTQQGMIIGTPPYMSPEQFSGEAIDARSDIYSLAVIAYEMLTGRLPFSAKTPWEWASKHLTQEPEALNVDAVPGLLPRHASAIKRALAKRPADRPQTVADFLASFTAGSEAGEQAAQRPSVQEPIGAPTTTLTEAISAQLRRPRTKPLLLGGVALVVVLVGAAIAWRSMSSEPATQYAPPSIPSVVSPSSEPTKLPTGVVPPSATASAAQAPGPRAASTSSGRDRVRPTRTQSSATPTEPPVSPQREPVVAAEPAREPAAPTEPRREPANVATRSEPRHEHAAPKHVDAMPDDLKQRLAQIQGQASTRPEVAVGLFQAAMGAYGNHPALAPVRAQLAQSGQTRIRELISGGRCAQAQAMFRALRAIQASGGAASGFGGACPLP